MHGRGSVLFIFYLYLALAFALSLSPSASTIQTPTKIHGQKTLPKLSVYGVCSISYNTYTGI